MTDIQAIRERHRSAETFESDGMDCAEWRAELVMLATHAHADRATLLSALAAAEARAEAAEARVGYLQTIIDCVVANCEANVSSYQERIETIHRVTSALALEWTDDRELKGPGQ